MSGAQDFPVWAKRAKYSSLLTGGGSHQHGGGLARRRRDFGIAVVDMIEISRAHPFGKLIAISCAIMPPIEAPAMCAGRMRSASISAMVSCAMSRACRARPPGIFRKRSFRSSTAVRRLPPLILLDLPMSGCRSGSPESARGELPAELVVPMDHLGAESHDQQHRLALASPKASKQMSMR